MICLVSSRYTVFVFICVHVSFVGYPSSSQLQSWSAQSCIFIVLLLPCEVRRGLLTSLSVGSGVLEKEKNAKMSRTQALQEEG